MKSSKKFMLIALVVLFMISIPQQSQAQERKPKPQIDNRNKREQNKPVLQRAMRDNDFSMVYKIVKNASFDKNKIDIIRVACINNNFSSKQCAKLLSLMSFDDNKLDALEIMAPLLVDADNYDKIIKEFSSKKNRDKAEKILPRRR